MTRMRWFAVIGAIGTAAATTNCQDNSVRDYLSGTGPKDLYPWELRVSRAICQLEQKSSGLDARFTMCPPGKGPGDVTPPPSYGK